MCFASIVSALTARAEVDVPWAVPNWSVESGLLWQIGDSTSLNYRLAPTQMSWRSAPFFRHTFRDGSRLVLRHRLSLLATWIPSGPESRYVGFGGSPALEWWNSASTRGVFVGIGGGAGWIDSGDVPGGQGQDFTLNWFARAGLEIALRDNVQLTLGGMFQHMSNGGRTNPNPGIDALGFTAGWAWSF